MVKKKNADLDLIYEYKCSDKSYHPDASVNKLFSWLASSSREESVNRFLQMRNQ